MAAHPGEYLLTKLMQPLGISVSDLAKKIDVHPGTISRVVSCKSDISASMAVKLAGEFSVTAMQWMTMQAEYSIKHEIEKQSLSMTNKVPEGMKPGSIYSTKNFGDMVVLEYRNSTDVTVRFVETGFVTKAQAASVRNGTVKDKLVANVYGVGFIGDGGYSCAKDPIAYQKWRSMIQRCYSKKHKEVYKSYDGCDVNKEWHNFQNFAEWFYKNYPNDGGEYQLDKDIKIPGNKQYSPCACSFVTSQENMQCAHAKRYSMIRPDGVIVTIFNMMEFCKENNLNSGGMTQAYLNDKKYKGWKSARHLDNNED